MANWNDPQPRAGFGAASGLTAGAGRVSYDMGLRRYMLSIYNYMASGVLLSGIVALLFASSGAAAAVFATPLRWLIALAPLGFVMAMSFGLNRMQTSTLRMLFWAFSVAMGLSLSSIFFVYTGPSIASTFFATAAAFAGLSLVGYTTKKDLSGFGTFLIMGVWGLLAAMVINMIWPSQGLGLAISLLGVVIFAGLTAYDTQRIKAMYDGGDDVTLAGRKAVMGSLSLYLNFINLFMMLLRLMGGRR